MVNGKYKNSTPVTHISGVPIYLPQVVDACLIGRLNLFLQGGTGTGKTQLMEDALAKFGERSRYVLARNDMNVRELFEQINLPKLREARSTADVRELTDNVNVNLWAVDELPNAHAAVRAQLFNLFDGFVELNGIRHPIGKEGYSVGIAGGNIGREFTESFNDLGRALKDRMHVTIDVDYFHPQPSDTLEILAGNTDPRVAIDTEATDTTADTYIAQHKKLREIAVPAEKLITAMYLVHGLDHCKKGSKRKMKDSWPTALDPEDQSGKKKHDEVSVDGLVLPLSMRAAKSVIRLSQALDYIAGSQTSQPLNPLESMMQAYRLVAPYSGVLYEGLVQGKFEGDRYRAIDAVIDNTKAEFTRKEDALRVAATMVNEGKLHEKVLEKFSGRWGFMRNALEGMVDQSKMGKTP